MGYDTVKSTHSMLAKMLQKESDLGTYETYVFQHIGSSPAPSKTTVLSWKLVLNRITSRANLAHQGVLPVGGQVIVSFVRGDRNLIHIYCCFVIFSAQSVVRGVSMALPCSLSTLFECLSWAAYNKKLR